MLDVSKWCCYKNLSLPILFSGVSFFSNNIQFSTNSLCLVFEHIKHVYSVNMYLFFFLEFLHVFLKCFFRKENGAWCTEGKLKWLHANAKPNSAVPLTQQRLLAEFGFTVCNCCATVIPTATHSCLWEGLKSHSTLEQTGWIKLKLVKNKSAADLSVGGELRT